MSGPGRHSAGTMARHGVAGTPAATTSGRHPAGTTARHHEAGTPAATRAPARRPGILAAVTAASAAVLVFAVAAAARPAAPRARLLPQSGAVAATQRGSGAVAGPPRARAVPSLARGLNHPGHPGRTAATAKPEVPAKPGATAKTGATAKPGATAGPDAGPQAFPLVLTAYDRRSCPAAAAACVDLAHRLTWLQSGGRITFGPVRMEPGPPGTAHATPRGTFRVAWKAGPDYTSTIYHDPMPWATFFAAGGIAFHGGSLVAWSHGCVHLTVADARYYNAHLPVGAGVVVF